MRRGQRLGIGQDPEVRVTLWGCESELRLRWSPVASWGVRWEFAMGGSGIADVVGVNLGGSAIVGGAEGWLLAHPERAKNRAAGSSQYPEQFHGGGFMSTLASRRPWRPTASS